MRRLPSPLARRVPLLAVLLALLAGGCAHAGDWPGDFSAFAGVGRGSGGMLQRMTH